MEKDCIDFEKDKVSALFQKILFPTLLGMVCIGIMTMIDGIFIGHGIGSDALAAVSIFAPLWALTNGIGLMLGMGCSVVASIHLAQGNTKAANINFTQSILFGTIVSFLGTLFLKVYNEEVARFLGASDTLLPYVLDYQKWMIYGIIPIFLTQIGVLVMRLDGSPKYAMFCSSFPAVVNVVLDYVFLFQLHWGLEGIAIATFLGVLSGGIFSLLYFLFLYHKLHFLKLKLTRKSLLLSLRNILYQIKIGLPAFWGEIGMTITVCMGNWMFIRYLKEDGVAAFSVSGYISLMIFMIGQAIANSAQPIISYNYGANQPHRVKKALKLGILTGIGGGIFLSFLLLVFTKYAVGLFLPADCNAFHIATHGLQLMSTIFVPFILNIFLIGYWQSVEETSKATILSLLRGICLSIPCFILVPKILGENGLWLAMTVNEVLTLIVALFLFTKGKQKALSQ